MTLKLLISILAFGMTFMHAQASVPTEAMTFNTNVESMNLTSTQEAKIQKAEEKIRAVIASEEFRTAVLNHTYGGKKTFVDNDGLTNAQIYQKVLDGAEGFLPKRNNAMDLGVKTYYENSSTVGYTSHGSYTIHMNTKFLNKYTATNVSRNMVHEWFHKLGFSHAVKYSKKRDYSVPYAIGKIMERLAARH